MLPYIAYMDPMGKEKITKHVPNHEAVWNMLEPCAKKITVHIVLSWL